MQLHDLADAKPMTCCEFLKILPACAPVMHRDFDEPTPSLGRPDLLPKILQVRRGIRQFCLRIEAEKEGMHPEDGFGNARKVVTDAIQRPIQPLNVERHRPLALNE